MGLFDNKKNIEALFCKPSAAARCVLCVCVLGLMRREVSERKKKSGRRASRDREQRKELE